jgi:hypothetical protein
MSDKSNTIVKAIVSTASMGVADGTAKGPVVDAYHLLKDLIKARCGKDSDLYEAVVKLE